MSASSPIFGTYRAVVVNNNDPLALERVTLRIPQVLGDAESNWATPNSPTNTKPNPGDVVWASFDGGDIAAPVYASLGLKKLSSDVQSVIDAQTTQEQVSARIPEPPSALTLSPALTHTSEGVGTVDVTASWSAPTQNNDGSALVSGSLAGYVLAWSYDGAHWSGGQFVKDTTWVMHGLTPGVLLYVRVLAFLTNGNASDYIVVNQVLPANPGPPDGSDIANKADTTYVQSRGMNLITNGTGMEGNNKNFSAFTYVAGRGLNGTPVFQSASGNTVPLLTDEFIPIHQNKTYTLTANLGQTGTATGAYLSAGFACYDAAKNLIDPTQVTYRSGTDTTLAADLVAGATTVSLTSSSYWSSAAGNNNLILWNYVDPNGYAWPKHTYSRNVLPFTSISGNVLTLAAPYAGPTVKAGTSVSNSSSGNTYNRALASSLAVDGWTPLQATVGTLNTSGTDSTTYFRQGTAFVKFVLIPNQTSSGAAVVGSQHAVSNAWLSEVSGSNLPDGSVGGSKITPYSVDTQHLTSTAIDGMTITGALLRTDVPNNKRWEIAGNTYAKNVISGYPGNGEITPGQIMIDTEGTWFSSNAPTIRLVPPNYGSGSGSMEIYSPTPDNNYLSTFVVNTDKGSVGTIGPPTPTNSAGAKQIQWDHSGIGFYDHVNFTFAPQILSPDGSSFSALRRIAVGNSLVANGQGLASVAANGGVATYTTTHGLGTTNIVPSVITGSARLTVGVSSITSSQVTFIFNNWTSSPSSATDIYWTCIAAS